MKGIILASTEKTGAQLYMACAPCHGQRGEKTALGRSDVIGNWTPEQIATALKEYRAGIRNKKGFGDTMKGQIGAYSDTDIETLADYISSLQP